MLRGNVLSLSTTNYLNFAFLLKACMHLEPKEHTGSWLAHQYVSSVPSSQNFLEKEMILNQRYLPHLNSDSANFFIFIFNFGYFSARNPNLLFIFENFVQKFSDLLCKLSAQNSKLWNLLSVYCSLLDHLCSDTL